MRHAFIGIDVGTSSTRAGIFDEEGTPAGDRKTIILDLDESHGYNN